MSDYGQMKEVFISQRPISMFHFRHDVLVTRNVANYIGPIKTYGCAVKMRNCHDKQFYDDMEKSWQGDTYPQLINTTCASNRETIIHFNHFLLSRWPLAADDSVYRSQPLKHLIFMITCDIALCYAFGVIHKTDFLLQISINISRSIVFPLLSLFPERFLFCLYAYNF